MASPRPTGPAEDEAYPGQTLGLPETGRGSLASWRSRVIALVVDWAVCTGVAWALFSGADPTTRSAATLVLFFLESALLGTLAGASLGQLLCRIEVLRLDRQRLGLPRAAARAGLVCLVLPALIVGVHRRGLHDLAVGTVVVNRR